MKYFIRLFVTIILFSKSLFAQYSTSQIKENFDYLSDYNYFYKWEYLFVGKNTLPPFNNVLLPIDHTLNNRMGDKYGDVLQALLEMYETTKDKGYLVKFVALTYHIQVNLRQDNGQEPYPGWREYLGEGNISNKDKVDYSQMYHDGRILAPMARYVYLLSQNPALAATPLPALNTLGNTFDALIYPSNAGAIGNQPYTYGGYANWLTTRLIQSITYFELNHWADNIRCYVAKPIPDEKNQRAQIVNQQASFGVALTYLGLAYNNFSLLQKAKFMGQRYKSAIIDLQSCKKVLGNYVPWKHYLRDVLEYVSASNAYKWKSYGWREQKCKELYGNEPSDYEDFAHAAYTLSLPFALYNVSFNGQTLFNDNVMVRFRNTLSKHIYAGFNQYNNCPDLHPGIEGDDIITDRTEYNGLNNPIIYYDILNWAHFSKFDGMPTTQGSTNVYDIMFEVYNCGVANQVPPENFSGLAYYGLAMLANEQWQRECVNLSLYKRSMVYNQDFVVKNKIIVEPASGSLYNSSSSYAEPKITTKKFTIEPGVTVNMLAGEEIHLSDGFHAKAGSNFHAGIIPNTCTNGGRVAGANSGQIPETGMQEIIEIKLDEAAYMEPEQEVLLPDISIYPNPSAGIFTIESEEFINPQQIEIYDVFGKRIQPIINQNNNVLNINLIGYSKGIYFIKIGTYSQKLIIE